MMRLTVDLQACVGHGRCYALAPEVFDADDQGHVVIVLDGSAIEAEVPDEHAGKVRAAVANCPEGALSIVD